VEDGLVHVRLLLHSLIQRFYAPQCHKKDRDVTRLGLGGGGAKDVAAPSNWNGNGSFLHGCFGHHAAVG